MREKPANWKITEEITVKSAQRDKIEMKDRLIHMEGKMIRYNLYPPKIFKKKPKDGGLTHNLIPTLIMKQQESRPFIKCATDKGTDK